MNGAMGAMPSRISWKNNRYGQFLFVLSINKCKFVGLNLNREKVCLSEQKNKDRPSERPGFTGINQVDI